MTSPVREPYRQAAAQHSRARWTAGLLTIHWVPRLALEAICWGIFFPGQEMGSGPPCWQSGKNVDIINSAIRKMKTKQNMTLAI